jgi:hypothetical protein
MMKTYMVLIPDPEPYMPGIARFFDDLEVARKFVKDLLGKENYSWKLLEREDEPWKEVYQTYNCMSGEYLDKKIELFDMGEASEDMEQIANSFEKMNGAIDEENLSG